MSSTIVRSFRGKHNVENNKMCSLIPIAPVPGATKAGRYQLDGMARGDVGKETPM